ncbi:hypothetical protein Y032_0062g3366 [Ancylostoma ceylanicum]|uniref:Uncharacterized protein n=1 Tax=Ancylostoma ceylanicum TaxID=53326 RepID=A0A016U1F6_9BILA|nr:hypothetical protein Y032_0062g3366 [Ancylostoma ceylanicum]
MASKNIELSLGYILILPLCYWKARFAFCRRRHIAEVQELELRLQDVSRDESSRFKRRVLSSDEPIIFIGQ